MTPNEERYLWLRDGKRRIMDDPFVMVPPRSRLYAIYPGRGEELDAIIDAAIFWCKVEELHLHNEVVERGLLPPGSSPRNLDDKPYDNALYKLTQEVLGWSDERVKPIIEEYRKKYERTTEQ